MLSNAVNLRIGLRVANKLRRISSASPLHRPTAVPLEAKQNGTTETRWENAKPFEEIPGPNKSMLMLNFVMPNAKQNMLDSLFVLRDTYGPFFRVPGLFGNPDIYIDMNPDDFPTIFRNEGKWPFRRNLDSVAYYREVHRRDYFQGCEGIVTTSGENWAKMRTTVNPILMQPKNVKLYLKTIAEINDEFIERIREIRDSTTLEMPDTFEDELKRLTLETMGDVALNTRLGLIRTNRDTPESITVIHTIRRIFDLAYELDVLPSIWKYVKTPTFWELMRTLDTFTNICAKYINEAMERIDRDNETKAVAQTDKEKSVLEKLLLNDKKLAVVMALDIMFAGVDTTSSALTGCLLCIAKNPEKQEILLQELKKILPEKDSKLTLENMQNMPYLRACIKESLRIYPNLAGTSRRIPVDLVLSGYQVKKGSDVMIASNALMRTEEFCPRAKEFLPERWLRGEAGKSNLMNAQNSFLFLPFGFGPRSCIGKRLVDMEMEITIARLVRNFNIEFNHPIDNAFRFTCLNVPNIPLNFKFQEREQ